MNFKEIHSSIKTETNLSVTASTYPEKATTQTEFITQKVGKSMPGC